MRAPSEGRHLLIALVVAGAAVVAAPSAAAAQVTAADYARAEQFLVWNAQSLVSGNQVNPRWFDGDRFWYRNRTPDGFQFILVDPAQRRRAPAFDHDRLASALSVAADTSYVSRKLPFEEFDFVDGDGSIQFHVADSVRFTCDIRAYTCAGPDSIPEPPALERPSPDGRWVAFEREENLWVRSVESGAESQLSRDGEQDWGYAVLPEGCCLEITRRRQEMDLPSQLAWSPDSRRIVTHKYDERNVEKLHLLEAATGRPILHTYAYALPGDSIIPTFDLYAFDVEAETVARLQDDPHAGFFASPDTAFPGARFSADGESVYFTHRARDFRRLELRVADATTGESRLIIEETGKTYLEMNQNTGGRPNWHVLGDESEIIWWSERDGWGHLYLYDAQSGAVKNRITQGPWLVADLLHVDETRRLVYFTAVGREEGEDPYQRQLYRVGLDGSGLQRLTPEDADHDVRVSPSGGYFVDSYSRRDTTPVTVVRGADGQVLQTLESADISRLLAAGWTWPVAYRAKGRDGATDVYGYLYFPSDFDPDKSYPVVDYIYPGPQVGPIGYHGFDLGARGTGLRSLSWASSCSPWMRSARRTARRPSTTGITGGWEDNGLPDHISAIKELARRYPQMDVDRVGIFGHSGGGFSSTDGILRYPEFFKVAVSGAGNHDQRGYHFPWGEKYHGPLEKNEDGTDNYDSQANQNLAANLEGKLMLSYGTLDDNVHPNMTLRVIEELIKHNKDFDLFVIPNGNHGYGAGRIYSIRRTWDYFVEHLLGEEPPREYLIRPAGS